MPWGGGGPVEVYAQEKGCPRRVGARRGRKEGRYLGDTPSTCPHTAEMPLHLAFIAPSPRLHSATTSPSHCITGDVWQASLGVIWRMERGWDATLRARWAQSSQGLGGRLLAREKTAAVGISRHEKTRARQNRDTNRRRPVAGKSPRGGVRLAPRPGAPRQRTYSLIGVAVSASTSLSSSTFLRP